MIALTILLFVSVFAVATFTIKTNQSNESTIVAQYNLIRGIALDNEELYTRLSMLSEKLEYHITQEEEGMAVRASLLGELGKRCVDTMAKKSNVEL